MFLLGGRRLVAGRLDPGQQVGVIRVGQVADLGAVAEGGQGGHGVMQCNATADHEHASFGVGRAQLAVRIGVQLERAVLDAPLPRLDVVNRRRPERGRGGLVQRGGEAFPIHRFRPADRGCRVFGHRTCSFHGSVPISVCGCRLPEQGRTS